MKFTSNRNIVLRSKNTGHAIEFLKGVPTHVPYGMHEECLEKGILPVDEEGAPVDPAENVVVQEVVLKQAPTDAGERNMLITEAFKQILARNNSKDFAGGGQPHPEACSLALGWRVDQKEVRQLWEKVRQKLLNKNKEE